MDPLDHQRLGVGRLVPLVVPIASVAHHVDDDVAAELAPVRHRQAHGGEAGRRIVRIDVHDGDVEALGEVARVVGRAALARRGREADLVVGDEVHRASRGVAGEAREIERLGHHSLRGEGGISMDEDGDGNAGVGARRRRPIGGRRRSTIRLGRPRATLDHGIDGLEVTGVRSEDDGDLPLRGAVGATRTVVVLDVVRRALRDEPFVAAGARFELFEDRLVGDAHDMGQHVQAAAMGHPQDDLVSARLPGQGDREVEHRHQHVEALDRESLLAEVGALEECLERLHVGQPCEQRPLLFGGEGPPVIAGFDLVAQPGAFPVAGDVLDLVGDGSRVGRAERGQHVGERLAWQLDAERGGRDGGHQLGCQAVCRGIERGIPGRRAAKRVKVRPEVAEVPVGTHQVHAGHDRPGDLGQRPRHGPPIARRPMALEVAPPRRIERRGIGEVARIEEQRVAGVDPRRRIVIELVDRALRGSGSPIPRRHHGLSRCRRDDRGPPRGSSTRCPRGSGAARPGPDGRRPRAD